MARADVEKRWNEFHRTGLVTVRVSPLKIVAMTLAGLVMAMILALLALAFFLDDGATALKGWIGVLFAPLFLVFAVLEARKLARKSQLTLSSHGITISANRRGERDREMGLRWEEMTHVELHSGSPQSASDDVRIHLASGAGANVEGDVSRGYVDLPDGFAMSKRDLAELLEAIRGFLAARR
ncbi:hypothetical protein [Brachybacterium paraconglomeratum]|uniref:hypothetical protein n=1 Tax=Brachybacterium paraconglomeratum TaxID=173362 RepID=UPI003F7BA812